MNTAKLTDHIPEVEDKIQVRPTYSLKGLFYGGSGLVLARLVSILLSIALVAIIPRLLNIEELGVWAVIGTTTGLLTPLSFGLAPATRNKLGRLKDTKKPSEEVIVFTSSFVSLCLLSLGYIVVTWILYNLLDFSQLFTIDHDQLATNAGSYLFFAIILSLLVIPFRLVIDVAYTYHDFKFASTYQLALALPPLVASVVCLVLPNRLLSLVIVNFLLVLGINVFSLFIFLRKQAWRLLLPSIKTIYSIIKPMVSSALYFWLYNSAWIVIFTGDTFIINKVINISTAAEYSLLMKIYFMVVTLYGLALAPMWNFYTDAANANDWQWIRNALIKISVSSIIGILIFSILISIFAEAIIESWTGVGIEVGSHVLAACAGWAVAYVWVHVVTSFLNGVGLLRAKALALLCGAAISVPLKVLLLNAFGVAGAPLATIFSLLPMIAIGTFQCYTTIRTRLELGPSYGKST